jgi:hypothetical protein
MTWLWLIAMLYAGGPATTTETRLLSDCSIAATVVAEISAGDPIAVRYSVGGGDEPCYAVSVNRGGQKVDAYLLGTTHPAVLSFLKEIREQPLSLPVAPTEKAGEKKQDSSTGAAGPSTFVGFRALDSRRRWIDLDQMNAPYAVLYFWRAGDRKFIEGSEALEQFYQQYAPKGFAVIGVGMGPGAIRGYQQAIEAIWPLIPDNGELASRFGVSGEGYYLLDRQRNVIATATRGSDVLAEFQRLGKLPR